MAFKNLIAFGAGEITPELAERGNLEKFRTGLKTLRNCNVTKMGGIINRPGMVRAVVGIETYDTKFHTVPNRQVVFEFKTDLVLIHTNYNPQTYQFTGFSLVNYPVPNGSFATFIYGVSDLKNLHFTNNETHLFVFCAGKMTMKILLDPPFTISIIQNYSMPISNYTDGSVIVDSSGFSAPSGYDVEYGYTLVKDGVESFVTLLTSATVKLPIASGQATNIRIDVPKEIPPAYTVPSVYADEIRYYRRPKQTGAWGFVGSAVAVEVSTGGGPGIPSAYWRYKIIDFGQDADYANQPPEFVSGIIKDMGVKVTDTLGIKPPTGLIYQNRLMIAGMTKKGLVFGSRTDATENFTRDFPLQDDSSVALKTGSDGGAEVGRFYDGRGLLITTSNGIYETPSDVLKPDTAYAIKRSGVIHDSSLPLLGSGKADSIFTYDRRAEGVFTIKPAGESFNYQTNEVSIFSAHLFQGKRPVSWTLQDDGGQVLWIVLDDGTFLSLSYQEDQQLQAWSRHDTDGVVKQVVTLKQNTGKDVVLFVVDRINSAGLIYRTLEALSDRKAEFLDFVGADCAVIFKNQMAAAGEKVTMTQVTTGDWSTVTLTYSGGTPIWSNTTDLGAVGSVFRFFNKTTRQNVDYRVTAYLTGPVRLTATLDTTLTPDLALNGVAGNSPVIVDEIYQTWNDLQGLGLFLGGKKVSVRLDGFTHASPLNTDPEKTYPIYTVDPSGANITLNGGERGAIISVGLPYAQDIQTLEVDTIEQSPVKLESQIANKIHISYYKSRGLYAKGTYPADDTVTGMENHETQTEPDEGILPMQPPMPYTFREEMVIEGDWQSKGSIALRNVDPQPVGIRAIILDEEIIE